MKRLIAGVCMVVAACASYGLAAEPPVRSFLIFLLEERQGSQDAAWWVSGNSLSASEGQIAALLSAQGYGVIAPEVVLKAVADMPENRSLYLSEEKALRLAETTGAGFIIIGKIETGINISRRNVDSREYEVHLSARLIRVADRKKLAYPDSWAVAADPDVPRSRNDAVCSAAEDVAAKVLYTVQREYERD